jgi:hypothetical protein
VGRRRNEVKMHTILAVLAVFLLGSSCGTSEPVDTEPPPPKPICQFAVDVPDFSAEQAQVCLRWGSYTYYIEDDEGYMQKTGCLHNELRHPERRLWCKQTGGENFVGAECQETPYEYVEWCRQ